MIAPMHTHLTRLIAAYTGRTLTPHHPSYPRPAGRSARLPSGRETVLLRTGWTQFDEDKAAQLSQVITCHVI
ncbi:hypothetical protein ACNKHS_04415 [Shigella flexneri]